MNVLAELVISLAAIPVFYLAAAFGLALWPYTRKPVHSDINFSVLPIPGNNETRAIEEYFRARDGKSLFLRRFSGTESLTVIMIHGSGSEGRYLVPMAATLANESIAEVILPDLRGHGRSGGLRGDVNHLGQLDEDLIDLITYVRVQNPLTKIILGGHSSGGGLVLKYAGTSGVKPVDGYILLAPYLGYEAPTVRVNSGGWVQVATKRLDLPNKGKTLEILEEWVSRYISGTAKGMSL